MIVVELGETARVRPVIACALRLWAHVKVSCIGVRCCRSCSHRLVQSRYTPIITEQSRLRAGLQRNLLRIKGMRLCLGHNVRMIIVLFPCERRLIMIMLQSLRQTEIGWLIRVIVGFRVVLLEGRNQLSLILQRVSVFLDLSF